ncbi:NADH-quinone oxidoreductase subunit G [Clostridium acetobutylicum]|uniref:Hydrogene dehydrogenase n=2 Tax=Clostridium acetobutylicum TaxID=1488 RepID=Q7D472_CLOAB|nr:MULTISPECIES: ferredoxin hydrogenase [Clostridium]AAB03723.1 hydrogenase I [Clostridium acetobutylicum ATCC 824]AAK78015.1 Hydrogene dehydrogenase [Clostridium acetobutylicum ATCC 824]ADZ19071.1 Hydrogene dehydrogenase [Clostridium acetobutylicum EA 2018]AEI33671.1 hydrogene dehydrogenase [Clostridium acetobutylicum DSM 1731]AWV81922.1 4Fe-4S dicluster domain-containing protein [Clostridium acetobutylicum]
MKTIILNGNEVHTDKDITILELARENNVDIPTLCFLKDCGNFGKCGVCMVEVEGKGFRAACVAKVEDGMVINTESDEVKERIKKRVSMLLDKHEFKCGQCSRRENCEFLKLVIKTKAKASKPFLPEDKDALVDNRSKAIVIDRSKCVLCGRCVAACKQHTSTCSIQFIKKDGQRAVGTVDDVCLDDSTCLLCGQCVIACPVAALKEKSHIEKVQEALNDPKKHVIVAMAPSVRTAMGELFKMGYGKDVTGKLYTALRMLGFDKVFDINFGADMTIMEEATELLGRVKNNGPFPMFTSCCPAWVRLAQNYHPELLDNLSSAKSPQQIFGTASKTYYPSISGIAPEDVYTVTIMPCNDKKYEADIPFMETNSLRDIDASLTTRELAKMIKDAKIKFADLEDGEVDPAMGTYSGAGAIFGATGGVMEAAIRSAKDFAENKELENVDYTEVRGFKGIKEAEVEIAGNKLNVAVINGASNFFEFMKSGKMNEKQYHFIEVMACPGGCINGGGQPHVNALDRENVDYRKLRASVLYNQDKNVLSKRKSHDNPAIIKMYDSYFGKPGEGLAHKLLHVKYTKDKNVSKHE